MAGEVEAAGAGEMNERGCCGGQGAVPQVDEFAATGIALLACAKTSSGSRSRKRMRMAR